LTTIVPKLIPVGYLDEETYEMIHLINSYEIPADFNANSKNILEKVGQEVALKSAEKDTKSEVESYWDRFPID
jgi:hypothetical protein